MNQTQRSSSNKPTDEKLNKSSDRNTSEAHKKPSRRKLQMSERDVRRFDELLQQRLQQISESCFQDGMDNSRCSDVRRTQKHHCSAPLTPHLSRRRKEIRLSTRSKSEEDTSRCGKQSDDDFQTRLEEIARQCNSRGIRGKGAAMTDTQNFEPKFTPKRHKKDTRKRGHSKSLADIDNNAPGINRINENRQKISKARWKSQSMGKEYASKYPNGRPFVVKHREPEIQPITDMLQVQQEVHYYHKHIEVGESTTKMTSLQSTATCEKLFSHSRSGAHHDCLCHPVHSGRLSPQTDMAVFNLDVHKLDQRLVRHWHRHDHHHFHIVHVSDHKRTQI